MTSRPHSTTHCMTTSCAVSVTLLYSASCWPNPGSRSKTFVQSSESADKNAIDFQRTVTMAINMVQNTSEVPARSTCYRYGGKLNGMDSQLVYAIKVGNKAMVCCRPEVTAGTKGTRGKGPPAEAQQVKQPRRRKYTCFSPCRRF